MKYVTNQFFADESGATAIEYALLAALIAVAIITANTVVGINCRTPSTRSPAISSEA